MDEEEKDTNIERAGVFAHETLPNVKNGEQHIIAVQPKTKVKNQRKAKKSIFGWISGAEEQSEESDPELNKHLMPK